jgi:hypothetical protein
MDLFETGRRKNILIGEIDAQRRYAVAGAKIPRGISKKTLLRAYRGF